MQAWEPKDEETASEYIVSVANDEVPPPEPFITHRVANGHDDEMDAGVLDPLLSEKGSLRQPNILPNSVPSTVPTTDLRDTTMDVHPTAFISGTTQVPMPETRREEDAGVLTFEDIEELGSGTLPPAYSDIRHSLRIRALPNIQGLAVRDEPSIP